MIYFIIVILIFLLLYTIIYSWLRNRKMYQTIDRMLDEVLNREVVTVSDIKEGEISALASKVIRLQEKMENELIQAEMEKEQVKGLISNMSHQLKTPLTSMYVINDVLLSDKKIDDSKKQEFLIKNRKELEISETLKNLITKFQDTVHDTAITYHRKLREKEITKSELDNIQGIGETKKQELLKHFGTISKIKQATIEELMEVKGISEKIAKQIKESL